MFVSFAAACVVKLGEFLTLAVIAELLAIEMPYLVSGVNPVKVTISVADR